MVPYWPGNERRRPLLNKVYPAAPGALLLHVGVGGYIRVERADPVAWYPVGPVIRILTGELLTAGLRLDEPDRDWHPGTPGNAVMWACKVQARPWIAEWWRLRIGTGLVYVIREFLEEPGAYRLEWPD
jgi:hypothetical protein